MYSRRRNYSSLHPALYIIGLIIVFIFASVILSIEDDNAIVRINQKVESINGTIVTIDSADIFEDKPFIVGKYERAYKFVYKVKDDLKEGWLKVGFSDQWIMDYQRED